MSQSNRKYAGFCCREILDRLLQKYTPMIRSICAQRLNCHQCDDLQQDAFLRVVRSCHRVRDPEHLPAYVRVVTNNLVSDRLRARRNLPRQLQSDDSVFEALPERSSAGFEDEQRELEHEIEKLPEPLRQVLDLFYFHRLDYAAIAAQTGLTVGAVGQRLSRARRSLRKAMAG